MSIINIGEVFNFLNYNIIQYFSFLKKISDMSSICEIGVVILIGSISYVGHKWLQHRLSNIIPSENSWVRNLFSSGLSFTPPLIAFLLLSFAMVITEGFTHNLEIYELAIKFTFIWLIWILTFHMISDLMVRIVICCTFIPFLILSSLGMSSTLLYFLDSLDFSIGDFRISVFLILKTLLISTCLFWLASTLSKKSIEFIENQKMINPEIRDLIKNIFQAVLYITVTLTVLKISGIDLKSFAIIGGAVGIGIGLGLQRIAASFISGVIILFEQNIKVGHLVEIPGGTSPGWVRHLGARSVVVDTGDGKELSIPNEEFLTKTIIDWTSRDRKIRTDLRIKVSFSSNLEKAKQIIIETASMHPNCSKSHSPSCFLEKFTDNGAQFLLQFWVDNLSVGKMDMQNDVLITIWKLFSKENIKFPSNFSNLNMQED